MIARRLTLGCALVSLCALAGVIALGGVAAQAEVTHSYLSQIKGFGEPVSLTIDSNSDVYVADRGDKTIDRFNAAGAPLAFTAPEPYVQGGKLTGSPSGSFEPEGVAVDNVTGHVYVADGAQRVVEVFSSTGEFLSQLTGTPLSAPVAGPFKLPHAVAVDQSTHDLYVSDSSNGVVDVFSATGEYLSQFGSGVLSSFYAWSLAVNDFTGTAYVADSAGPERIFVFNSLGALVPPELTGAGAPTGLFQRVVSVGLNQASGQVYVADLGNGAVDEFSSSSSEEYEGQVAEGHVAGMPANSLQNPTAVAVDPASGDLYAANFTAGTASGVVDVFGPDIVVPGASTEAASNVAQASATLHGTVNPAGIQLTSCEFEYGTNPIYGRSVPCAQTPAQIGKGAAPVPVSAEPPGLLANTTYHFRLRAVDANGASYGRDEQFTTPGPPLVRAQAEVKSTERAGQTAATLQAQIDPDGRATTYRFEYGETTSYGTSVPVPDGAVGSGEAFVSVPAAELSALKIGTTYHYRVVASNEYGTATSPDQVFQTVAAVLIEPSASEVAATSATLDARINPLGNDTHYYFEYGTSTSYSKSLPAPPGADIGSGESGLPVSVHLQGLAAGTVYHYRVVAANEPGGVPMTVESPDETFLTQAAGTEITQPDGRVWEMVSPPNKQGAEINPVGVVEGSDIQASAEGGGITYTATAPFVANPAGSRAIEVAQVISNRHAPGSWATADITTAHNEGATALGVGNVAEYKLFSTNLSLGFVEPVGCTPLPPLPPNAESSIYLRAASGEYKALVTSANVLPGAKFGLIACKDTEEVWGHVRFAAASPDLNHIVLGSKVQLTSTPVALNGANSALYEWVGGQLLPASVLPDSEFTAEGSMGFGADVRHAVSDDGSRLVWNINGRLYVRDMARKETVEVDAAQGTAEPVHVSAYQTANGEDSRIFFTSPERLTANSTASGSEIQAQFPDLYEFEVTSGGNEPLAGRLTDLTVDGNAGEAANVRGVIGASEDGSYVYFVAGGVLGDAAEHGAKSGDNLYVERYDAGTKAWMPPTFIAALSDADKASWGDGGGGGIGISQNLTEMTARVSPNGRYLAFMSERSLTGYVNNDASSDAPDEEVFLYDASAGRVVCASCNPTGARPSGVFDDGTLAIDPRPVQPLHWLAGNIPGWTTTDLGQALYQSRYLSSSGRLFFNSSDALVPADVNGKEDVYEYEPAGVGSCQGPGYGQSASVVYSESVGGCIGLISAGTSSNDSVFMDASETGGDVFFLTLSRLAPQDYDTSIDMYDAHECTPSAPCAPPAPLVPPPCTTGDACKPGPTPQPTLFGEPSSETFSGAGNIVPSTSESAGKQKASAQAQKLAKALKACRKKAKRKRAGCERQARKRYGAKQSRAGKSLSVGTRR